MVLYQPVRVQDVGANLAAEVNVGLGSLKLIRNLPPPAQFQFVKARAEHLHRHFSIAVLRAFVLALRHGPGGNVGDAHG
jgi:hypothetical protein